MKKKDVADAAPAEQWTLIRGARQLLTLRGSSGPRRGAAMSELNSIPDGALLLRNGVIHEMGPSRRVENLAAARKAREIVATGKIVMPAFVDADGVLVYPPAPMRAVPDEPSSQRKSNLRVLSRRLLESGAANFMAEWTRGGTLSIGAHTAFASNLKDTIKILRVHRSLQGKPMRIRSVFSPRLAATEGIHASDFIRVLDEKWFPVIRRRKLAGVVEFTFGEDEFSAEQIREASVVAANHGFAIRIRCNDSPDADICALSREAGVLGLIGLPPDDVTVDIGGVYILPAARALSEGRNYASAVRRAVDGGMAVALASSYRTTGQRSANPQYLLYLAMERFGLTCEEAIMACTYNAACSLKMSHVTGSLEPGKSADLVMMELADYRDLARRVGHSDVLMVMRGGQPVYRRAPVNAIGAELQ